MPLTGTCRAGASPPREGAEGWHASRPRLVERAWPGAGQEVELAARGVGPRVERPAPTVRLCEVDGRLVEATVGGHGEAELRVHQRVLLPRLDPVVEGLGRVVRVGVLAVGRGHARARVVVDRVDDVRARDRGGRGEAVAPDSARPED